MEQLHSQADCRYCYCQFSGLKCMQLPERTGGLPSQGWGDDRILKIIYFLKNQTGTDDQQCCYILCRCCYVCRTKQGRTARALWEISWYHGMSHAIAELSHKPRFNCTAQLTIGCTQSIIRVFTNTGYLNPISLRLDWSIFRIRRPISYFTKTCSEVPEFHAQGYLTVAPCNDVNALIQAKLSLITDVHGVLRRHRGNLPQPLMDEKVQHFQNRSYRSGYFFAQTNKSRMGGRG